MGTTFTTAASKVHHHKWLDPLSLFERILPTVTATIDQIGALTSDLDDLAIKFFIAPILEKAAKASDSLRCQEKYHNALSKHLQGRIEIVKGYYSLTEARAKVIDANDPKKWPRDCVEIPVWKLEEKQSDVNLSVNAVVDAMAGGIEHVVIVTIDTGIEPALKMIRAHTKAAVGLIVPTTDHQRQPNIIIASAGLLLAAALPLAQDALTDPINIFIAVATVALLLTTEIDTLWIILGAASISLTSAALRVVGA